MMKKILLISLILIGVTALTMGECAAQPKKEIVIYSARFGGINYLAGLALAEMINKTHPWLRATNLESTGSIENVRRDYDNPSMKAKTVRLGVGHVFWAAKNGQAPVFEKKYKGMKVIFSHAITLSGLFATTDPNIKEPQDLVGKKVGVGEKGSAFLVETQFLLRDCWGIWDKIKPEYLGFKAARDAFMDGLLDAVYCSGNYPGKGRYGVHPLMKEAVQLKKGLHFVTLTKEDLDRGAKASGWPVGTMIVPAGAFARNVPVQDLVVYNTHLMVWAYSDLDEGIVYEIVKTAHNNIKKFGDAHVSMKVMSPEVMAWLPASSEDEVHPGALKYYKEQGIKVSVGGAKPKF